MLLGGNYVSGVALGKCVEYGYEFADQIAAYVSSAATAAAKPSASRSGTA